MIIPSGFTYQELRPYEINNEFRIIKGAINGGIQFGLENGKDKNMNGAMFRVSFPVANTDVSVTHGLRTIPVGYLVLKRDAAGVVYDGIGIWSVTRIYLRSSLVQTALIFILR